jgi:hypothetical protein
MVLEQVKRIVACSMIGFSMLWQQAVTRGEQEITIVVPNEYADAEARSRAGVPTDQFRFQQVFAASEFATLPPDHGPIVSVAMRPDSSVTLPASASFLGTVIKMSTTDKQPGKLSNMFASKTGLDETVVFDGELTLSTTNEGPAAGPRTFDLVYKFQTPFAYDPSQGNLLFDIASDGTDVADFAVLDFTSTGREMEGVAAYFRRDAPTAAGRFARGFIVQFTFALTPSPLAGDFDSNGVLDAQDIDLLTSQVRVQSHPIAFDLTNDKWVDQHDRRRWVSELRKTYFGDSNLDGEFNSQDFVAVFQAGQYEDSITGNSTWSTGDWDGNGDFDSGDFVFAFQEAGYEKGPRAVVKAVPESSALSWLLLILVGVGRRLPKS